MTGRPSLWIVSPAHGRFAVTRLAFAQRKHLIGELARRGIDAHCVVVADDENLEIAAGHGFETVEMDNTRIGRKWNAGITFACEQGAEFVSVIGSDDWAHPDLFELPEQPARRDPVVLTGRRLTICDLSRGVLKACQVRGPWGCIPWVLPRAVLEPSRFAPCKPEQRYGLDGSLVLGLRVKPEWRFADRDPLDLVDFKTDGNNITPYKALASNIGVGEELDAWSALSGRYPAQLVRLAKATHLELAAAA